MKSLDKYKVCYMVPKKENIKIACNKAETEAKIENSGIIKLSPKCKLGSKDLNVTHRRLEYLFFSQQWPQHSISRWLKKLLDIRNFSSTDFNIEGKKFLFLEEIEKDFWISLTKLDDIINRAEEIGSKLHIHNNLSYSVGIPSTLVVMIIVITTVYIIKYKKKNDIQREVTVHYRNQEVPKA